MRPPGRSNTGKDPGPRLRLVNPHERTFGEHRGLLRRCSDAPPLEEPDNEPALLVATITVLASAITIGFLAVEFLRQA